MGYRYKASCSKCDYDTSFLLGTGINDSSFENVRKHFQDMDMELWNFLCSYRNLDFLSFRYELGRCMDCKQLVRVPVISFIDGKDFVGGKCNTCGSLLGKKAERIPEEQYGELRCPHCEERLIFELTGLWD